MSKWKYVGIGVLLVVVIFAALLVVTCLEALKEVEEEFDRVGLECEVLSMNCSESWKGYHVCGNIKITNPYDFDVELIIVDAFGYDVDGICYDLNVFVSGKIPAKTSTIIDYSKYVETEIVEVKVTATGWRD